MGVSIVREVTGLRTQTAPGVHGQRGREVGVVEGGAGGLHCMESTEGVTAVVEVGAWRVSHPTTVEESPE